MAAAEEERLRKEKEKLRKEKEKLAAELACQCKPKTFKNRSNHSWVEFRLPQGTDQLKIQIPGGAYNNYVFPLCNRVHWSDLTFKCNCGTWKRISGNWDADALCHGSKGKSPYVFVGNH